MSLRTGLRVRSAVVVMAASLLLLLVFGITWAAVTVSYPHAIACFPDGSYPRYETLDWDSLHEVTLTRQGDLPSTESGAMRATHGYTDTSGDHQIGPTRYGSTAWSGYQTGSRRIDISANDNDVVSFIVTGTFTNWAKTEYSINSGPYVLGDTDTCSFTIQ